MWTKKVVRHPQFTATFNTENGYLSFTGNITGISGAVGGRIAEVYPELLPVAIVHLSNLDTGEPMHAWANAEHFKSTYKAQQFDGGEGAPEGLRLKKHLRCDDDLMQRFLDGDEDIKEDLESLWYDQMEEAKDIVEDLETNLSGKFVDPFENSDLTHQYEDVLECFSTVHEAIALAKCLDIDLENVSDEGCGHGYSAEGCEYICCGEEDALEMAEESLSSYVDECILPEVPENYRDYFDTDKFIRDCIRDDGLGHVLASYDGCENTENYSDNTFYIYRTS